MVASASALAQRSQPVACPAMATQRAIAELSDQILGTQAITEW